jgi:prophage regulatory protein
MSPSILRLPKVKSRTGLSRSTIYLRIGQGTFPQPVSLGDRAVGWREEEIEQWLLALERKLHCLKAESSKATPALLARANNDRDDPSISGSAAISCPSWEASESLGYGCQALHGTLARV